MKAIRSAGLALTALTLPCAYAAQLGPHIPSHRFPTDRSFHIGYNFRLINSANNFTGRLVVDPLLNDASLRIIRHQFSPEFQPSRQLSIGARINVDQITLSDFSATVPAKKSLLGDQVIFAEFRMLDEPGSSLGVATVMKVPAYSNPTLVELNASDDPTRTILAGDAQVDATVMLTSEYWAGAALRFRGDAGYTARLDGYAPELPFNASLGIVTPKMDLEFRVRGNFALGEGTPNDADSETIRRAFADSDYAYSPNPWVIVLEPHVELWISAKMAVTLQYSYSLMGNRTASYHAMGAGFMYRWAETTNRPRRTFQEVGIETDQEAGKFEGDTGPDSQFMDTDPVFEN